MVNHVKPTSEELEANAAKAAEELEAMKADSEANKEIETKDPTEEIVKEEESVKSDEETVAVAKEEEQSKEVEKTEEVEKNDYKKRFVESTREGQILSAKNKKLADALEKASTLAAPTEDDLKHEYSNWEEMTDFEKRLATDNLHNSRRFQEIDQVTADFKDLDQWTEKVDTFIDDPKTLISVPELEGKQSEFKVFATKPSRRGVDFDDLVSAFLFSVEKEKASKPSNKGKKMFEVGNGGSKETPKPKSDKISVEQGRQLRETDYPKWKEYLKADKIESI